MLTLFLAVAVAVAGEGLPPMEDLVPDVPSFTTAKKRMYEIHVGQPTLYCGCTWADKVTDLSTCGLDGFDSTRWNRTEAEHIVPASRIGKHHDCWAEGRTHCIKTDPLFKAAHNDLHNLYPAVGQINLYRSSNAFGLIDGEVREWGACDFERDLEADRVEPSLDARGIVARTALYMETIHGITLEDWERRIFLHWHQTYPVTDWERERNAAIAERQGNSNPFVQ
jgi:deoxyribonuclease-1